MGFGVYFFWRRLVNVLNYLSKRLQIYAFTDKQKRMENVKKSEYVIKCKVLFS